MKAVVAAFYQEKALVGAFSVITNLRMKLFQALSCTPGAWSPAPPRSSPRRRGSSHAPCCCRGPWWLCRCCRVAQCVAALVAGCRLLRRVTRSPCPVAMGPYLRIYCIYRIYCVTWYNVTLASGSGGSNYLTRVYSHRGVGYLGNYVGNLTWSSELNHDCQYSCESKCFSFLQSN